MATICSYLPCGADAVPGSRPHLCPDHAPLEVCPTCEWWPGARRRWCRTCGGATYCSDRAAAVAVARYDRWETWERPAVPLDLRDTRWRSSKRFGVYTGRAPLEAPEIDLTDFGREGACEAEGEGGGYPTPTVASFAGRRGAR